MKPRPAGFFMHWLLVGYPGKLDHLFDVTLPFGEDQRRFVEGLPHAFRADFELGRYACLRDRSPALDCKDIIRDRTQDRPLGVPDLGQRQPPSSSSGQVSRGLTRQYSQPRHFP
jgi:hypothetical protein